VPDGFEQLPVFIEISRSGDQFTRFVENEQLSGRTDPHLAQFAPQLSDILFRNPNIQHARYFASAQYGLIGRYIPVVYDKRPSVKIFSALRGPRYRRMVGYESTHGPAAVGLQDIGLDPDESAVKALKYRHRAPKQLAGMVHEGSPAVEQRPPMVPLRKHRGMAVLVFLVLQFPAFIPRTDLQFPAVKEVVDHPEVGAHFLRFQVALALEHFHHDADFRLQAGDDFFFERADGDPGEQEGEQGNGGDDAGQEGQEGLESVIKAEINHVLFAFRQAEALSCI
jgi:hypothetical protein